ncbi:MAG: hypothetical protein ACFFDH_15990 [Promethearchaeota archaeon]
MRKIISIIIILVILVIIIPISIIGFNFLLNNDNSGGDDVNGGDNDSNIAPPENIVNLFFIHHSVGEWWLRSCIDDETNCGNLGQTLNNNNYYVSESYYSWNPASGLVDFWGDCNPGDATNTNSWQLWFNDDPELADESVMPYVYDEVGYYPDHFGESIREELLYVDNNTISPASGENTIIMFKSCFPESEVGDSITDEQDNYNVLLPYFEDHQDKLFILIIPPPEIDLDYPANTRVLANWLVNDWLANFSYQNVGVFDFYNVLTDPDNHHTANESGIYHHIESDSSNEIYPDYHNPGDDHPIRPGLTKASNEFVLLLNYYYHRWQEQN